MFLKNQTRYQMRGVVVSKNRLPDLVVERGNIAFVLQYYSRGEGLISFK